MVALQLCCVPDKTTEEHLFHHRVSSLSSATHPASLHHLSTLTISTRDTNIILLNTNTNVFVFIKH